MPTIFTVGFGGTHQTIQAAFNAIPNPPTGGYEIHIRSDQEYVFTGSQTPLAISSRTTSPTNYILIRAAPGASFKDHPSVRSNPLRYDPTKGVAIKCADSSAITLNGPIDITIRGLQVKQVSSPSGSFDIIKCITSSNLILEDCIVEQEGSDNNDCIFLFGVGCKVRRCVVVHGGANPDTGIKLSDFGTASGEVTDCTVVRPPSLSPAGIGIFNKAQDNTFVVRNNICLNFGTDYSQLSVGSDFNATDKSSGASSLNPSANNVYSVPNTTATFEQPSTAGGLQDFRLKRGSLPENKGFYDLIGSFADITGLVRANLLDLGCWEIEPLNPLAIDDRTIALLNIGQTVTGVRFNPIVIGNDFRVRRVYTGLPPAVIISTAWFTVKKLTRLPDGQALINKQITAALTSQGQITDADSGGGQIALFFDALSTETALARDGAEYYYDIKVLTVAGLKNTLESGSIPFTKGVRD